MYQLAQQLNCHRMVLDIPPSSSQCIVLPPSLCQLLCLLVLSASQFNSSTWWKTVCFSGLVSSLLCGLTLLIKSSKKCSSQCKVSHKSTIVEQRSRWRREVGNKASRSDSEVNMFCEVLSSAVIDSVFSFSFSKPIKLLAFETGFHALLSVRTDIPELLTWLCVVLLESVASPFILFFFFFTLELFHTKIYHHCHQSMTCGIFLSLKIVHDAWKSYVSRLKNGHFGNFCTEQFHLGHR